MAVQQYEAGSEVLILAKIYDQREKPPVLFNPDEVRVLLARPDGSIAVNYALMTLGATGNYSYAYQTISSDQAGIWTVQIKTQEGSSIVIRSSVAAFELLSTTPAGALVTQGIDAAPASATYITQTPHALLTAEQALSALSTGYMKVTTSTGVVTSQVVPIPLTDGGTGLITIAQGDILYGSAADVLARLAKNASASRYLSNTGGSNNPAWAQVNLADGVTGVLPVDNGGTGATTGAILTMQFSGLAVPAAATRYLRLGEETSTETNAQFLSPVTGFIIGFTASASGAPVGAETFTYRARVDAAAVGTALTLTGSSISGSVGSDSTAVTAGVSLISFRLVTSAGAAVVDHHVALILRATSAT